VAKQDANEAKNPGGSAGGFFTRDKKNPTDAYGSSATKGGEEGEEQVQVCFRIQTLSVTRSAYPAFRKVVETFPVMQMLGNSIRSGRTDCIKLPLMSGTQALSILGRTQFVNDD